MKKILPGTASVALILLGLTISHPIKVNLTVKATTIKERNAPLAPQGNPPPRPLSDKSNIMPGAREAAQEAAPQPSEEEIELALGNIADAEIPATLENLLHQPGPTARELRQLLMRRWAERDVAAAAAWATQLPEGDARNQVLEQVAIVWANSDLTDATVWLQNLPDGESKYLATLSTAYEATRTDPVAALELASKLLASPERDELLAHAIRQWATENFATASDWAAKIPDTTLRQEMQAAVAVAGADENAAAAALIASSLAPGETQGRAAVAITQRWTQSAPQDAAAWISQFPDMPVRDAAVENLVGLWAQHDSAATVNWLSTLPSGSLRTAAIKSLAANQSQFASTP